MHSIWREKIIWPWENQTKYRYTQNAMPRLMVLNNLSIDYFIETNHTSQSELSLNCYESQSDDKIILGYCLTDLHSKYGGQFNSLGCSQLDKLSVRLDR